MKNLVSVLAVSVLAFCLVGCGQQAPKQPEMKTEAMPAEAPQAEKAAPTAAAEPAVEPAAAEPAAEPAK